MILCQICSQITPESIRLRISSKASPHMHHGSLRLLRQSAEHCSMCSLMIQALQLAGLEESVQERAQGQAEKLDEIEQMPVYLRSTDNFGGGPEMKIVSCNVAVGDQYGRGFCTGRLSVYADEENPAAKQQEIGGREVGLEPASPRNLAMVKRWLDGCTQNHESCARDTQTGSEDVLQEAPVPLPSRVLFVGSDQEPIRLVSSGRMLGTYACLSHCWGQLRIQTTTRANIQAHLQSIELSSLPKTFQDAIVVARCLGTEYLWIDSLCIIQDDKADWEREAPLMGRIYRDAHYTISADGAPDGSVGCFIPRLPISHQPVTIHYTSERFDDRPCKMTFALRNGTARTDIDEGPLNQRGWTLQERILSRRIIHFGAHLIHFECQTQIVGEDGFIDEVHAYKNVFDLRSYLGEESADYSGSKRGQPLAWRWYAMVHYYTQRHLTFSSDKLVAVDGLAREIERRCLGRYFAGLWEDGLHYGLLWQAEYAGAIRPSSTYRAPSWSWASVDGPIAVKDVIYAKTGKPATSTPLKVIRRDDPKSSLDCWAIIASLKIACASYTGVIARGNDAPHSPPSKTIISRVLEGRDGDQIGEALLDFEPPSLPVNVLCLAVCVESGWENPGYGILLVEEMVNNSNGVRCVRRIGAGHINRYRALFEDVPVGEVCIL